MGCEIQDTVIMRGASARRSLETPSLGSEAKPLISAEDSRHNACFGHGFCLPLHQRNDGSSESTWQDHLCDNIFFQQLGMRDLGLAGTTLLVAYLRFGEGPSRALRRSASVLGRLRITSMVEGSRQPLLLRADSACLYVEFERRPRLHGEIELELRAGARLEPRQGVYRGFPLAAML